MFNIIQPVCTVKSLLTNVEDNDAAVGLPAWSRSDNKAQGVTVTRTTRKKPQTASDRRNAAVNAVEKADGPPSVGKPAISNDIKSGEESKSDSPTNSRDLEDQRESSERVGAISEIWEDIAHDVLSRHDIEENAPTPADDAKPEKRVVIRSERLRYNSLK